MKYNKQHKKAIKQMIKLIKIKMEGKHPSKEQMIKFVKKYKNHIATKIIRPHFLDILPDEFHPASYYQFLLFTIRVHPSSKSFISISCLPYKEINDILLLDENLYLDHWEEEENIDDFLYGL